MTSATTLSAQLRRREKSVVDVVGDVLARIHNTQPVLNAFALTCEDLALAAAEEADRALQRGQSVGPLHGVSVSIKDIINTAGLRTAWGSRLMAANVPTEDAIAVSRLKRAGAIVIGKTTTPEFAHKLLADSPLTGSTRNPWNLGRTPGGSSAGSAVAVAAGLGPLSLATDAGGSTRLPAACTGIVGLKPTLGLVPHGQVPDGFNNFIHIGVMARTVADVALMLDVLCGPDVSDPHSLRAPPIRACEALARPMELKGVRISWRPFCGNELLDPATRRLCEQVLGQLASAGAAVSEDGQAIDNAEAAWRTLQQANWAARFGRSLGDVADQLDPSLVEGIKAGLSYSGQDLLEATYRRTRLFRSVQGWFCHADFVVTPTMSRPPLEADHPALAPIEIGGRKAGDMRASWIPYLNLFNLTGHPAVSVPCGFTPDGLPSGLQIVAPWYGDADVLRLADQLEQIIGWQAWLPPFIAGRCP